MRGRVLSFTLFGESHGKGVGVVITGIPPGIKVSHEELVKELERRKGIPGLSTARSEPDNPIILSGIFRGYTTGTPIAVLFENKDVDSSYYEDIKDKPRPGHADYPARIKYFGYNDYRGGGHFSGRLTVGIVTAGYFAKKILEKYGIRIRAYIKRIGRVEAKQLTLEEILSSENPFCPDEEAFEKMVEEIELARREGDSVGGIVEVVAVNVPPGLGGPYEEDIEADLASAFFRIPAVKGVEFGLGFKVAEKRGSEVNDPYVIRDGKVVTKTNNHGGVLGGITTGMPIIARIAFKPTPSIYLPQRTVDLREMKEVEIKLRGRFDPSIVPRALPVVEGVMAFVLADHLLFRRVWELKSS
ncbi:chorismate synthase [Pyrococcus abyssi]|uniref:Chorismate synthase n=1 Tax=Pyrococcus abyssi (strain GE5 / Orsay) TaxID=272844 RepID=AROC_PYRAB|nr:chorismate synthase [Pyrococcus abyssi]Q9V1H0.1 RecName: Full=Chorismate synthase; Short=CS; AltName: Full=5-enolpyruvylshikimate-3-phosphate phospholyase [Pyrococcus abyssi GE5]CAB49379.1 aroC chorismate synthase [Pyrococcus abyssi GE5]CCE69840.1 TPA: chorismate synthase [Pyrococcus abyssi GE5]